ncbi:DMT family transporter [Loktanella sp. IMCC34160]|uniref:DMT family transporter n=1 Tax=Loktanella sp. IMCC34160 TaxID=2510646 RepID=UPI00101BE2F3|nr:DMT family transporter [Loktanella sp. IMCC34160]RYG92815.1 DMT family transporter [Loktanella sp. IMCC34160]
MTPIPARGHLAMLAFSVLVAGAFSLGARAANLIDPGAITAARFWIAAAIVGAAAWMTGGLSGGGVRAPWRYLILGGVFSVYFVLMFEGLKTAQPVSAAAVFTLTPIMAGVFGWIVLRQVLSLRILAGLALGLAGALWVIFRGDMAALLDFAVGRGEVIYFYGCIAHALYPSLVRLLNRGETATQQTFGTLVAGAVLLTLWGWPAIRATDWAGLPMIVWVTLGYVAVFSSAATFVLLQYAVRHLPSSKVMAYTYLVPSWVILWDVASGLGWPPATLLIGIGMTVAALLWLLRA